MKICALLCLGLGLFASNAFAQTPDDVQRQDLVTWVEALTGIREIQAGSLRGRLLDRHSGARRDLAARYLESEFSRLGYEAQRLAFRGGQNVVARRASADGRPILFVSAHYDSMETAGADDDATGVTALLVAAKALSDLELDLDVRFVAFDLEEDRHQGSRAFVPAYVTEEIRSRVLGDIQLEMLGYDGNRDGHFNLIDCLTRFPMNQALVDSVLASVGPGLTAKHGCTTRSDHASFWSVGIPAIVLSENFFFGDANPCYHQTCDRIDRLNMDYFESMVELLIRTILRTAGA